MRQLWDIIVRQTVQMTRNHLYLFCVIIFPIFVMFFFTDLMKDGLPTDMPIGVVDLDNSSTSRKMMHTLDGFQQVKIKNHYNSVEEARRAMQRGDIYAFFYIPHGMNKELQANRQPTISFYYNSGLLLAGSLTYKDMTVVSALTSAATGMAKLSALGLSEKEIMAMLQPISVSTHLINNPTMDYNVYLSTTLIPACLGIFIFLVTTYSLGTELKFGKSKQLMKLANGKMAVALTGKMIPQTIIFTFITFLYICLLFGLFHFPYSCDKALLFANGFLFVLAAQGFGIFIFGMMPSLRLSMSTCALWAVLSFSICGFTYPIEAMHPALQTLAWFFPMRHYFEIYQKVVLNGYGNHYAWMNYAALMAFALLPLTVIRRIRHAMLNYTYTP